MHAEARIPLGWAAGLLVALGYIYYSPTLQRSSNDGSHLALVQAIVEDHTFCIDKRFASTSGVDYAMRDGHFYSDRAPGTAFMAAVCVALGLDVKTFPALVGVTVAFLSYVLARRWAGVYASLLTALAVALGTLVWRYAHLLFSHVPAAMLVLASVYLALRIGDEARSARWVAPLLGWAVGYAAATEYQLIILTPLLTTYVVACRWRHGRWLALRTLWPAALTWALAMGLLAFYHWSCFGSPWHTAYAYRPGWQESMAWSGDLREGLQGLLFGGGMVRGLFTLSPVAWLAVWGYALQFRRQAAEAALCLGTFVAVLVTTAAHATWAGGTAQDTRYLTCVAPVLFLALGVWIDGYMTQPCAPARRFLTEGAFYLLLFFTVGMNGHELFYRYAENPAGHRLGLVVLSSFDPIDLYQGLLAGTQFDTLFWALLGCGAAGALVSWLLAHPKCPGLRSLRRKAAAERTPQSKEVDQL
ncbi:MAG: hypothetical protein HPY69_02100 [Armatimonadetes bacterium]|nr:hypothetical protein [Armatimonadota bacterium]